MKKKKFNNGCFDTNSVSEFQKKLLRKEIARARQDSLSIEKLLNDRRKTLQSAVSDDQLISIAFHSRIQARAHYTTIKSTHDKKLLALAEEQERPLFSVDNTVICHNLDSVPPEYVMKTLSLGPKNAVLDRFEQNDVLAELDDLLKHCKQNKIDSQVISDINIATMKYIKKVFCVGLTTFQIL